MPRAPIIVHRLSPTGGQRVILRRQEPGPGENTPGILSGGFSQPALHMPPSLCHNAVEAAVPSNPAINGSRESFFARRPGPAPARCPPTVTPRTA
ncbi:hypothetical protein [Streptomyces sp. NPDC053720]|uniref:hypothetical protein n=1 Tax=unclassified Streptomyces TaxID=2593676 RepID=UPI003445CD21